MISSVRRLSVSQGRRAASNFVLPRIVNKRPTEQGPGGRASDAGFKVAVFGGTGFLGRYLLCELGKAKNAREGWLHLRDEKTFLQA
jgi:hypothetical protein